MTRDTTRRVARYWNDIAADFDAIYSGRGKSALARWLDRTLRWDIHGRFEWVMARAGDVRGRTVCDVGCGSGRFVAAFARRGAAQVTGVDIAPAMIALADRLATDEGVRDRCEFVVSDIAEWTTDRVFDLTVAIGFWDYIAQPAERLRRIRAMTGGTFFSAWPRRWTWRAPVRKLRLALSGCPVYFFGRDEVERLLHEAGFDVVRVDMIGQLFCVEARPRQPEQP